MVKTPKLHVGSTGRGCSLLGVVLCDGETAASFGEGLFAVPIRALWETPPAAA
jgi:hypothetical protein